MVFDMTLNEIYEQYKDDYKKSGIRPHPAQLLAILILHDKDKYKVPKLGFKTYDFYEVYCAQIIKNIDKVILDFDFKKEELIILSCDGNKTLEEILRKDEDSYNYYKNRLAFKCGYQIVEWGNRYFPNVTPEEVYYLFVKYHKEKSFSSTEINKPPVLKRMKGHLKHRGQGVK